MPRALRLFISHASRDEEHRRALETHLAVLERQRIVEILPAASALSAPADDASSGHPLTAADLILLLVTPDFVASERHADAEVRRAMERHEAGTSRVLPVIVRPVDWRGLAFSALHPTPRDARPITLWPDRDEAWRSVAESVREVVAALVARERGVKVKITVVEGPDTGRSFTFAERDRFVVGRAADATFRVADTQVSRHHFLIEINPPHVLVRDLGSTNRTYLNGEPEPLGTATLRSGDRLRAGATTFALEVVHPPPPPPVQLSPDQQATMQPQAATARPVTIRCFRCGRKAPGEEPSQERAAYFCEACRAGILTQPVFPSGYSLVREIGRGGMGAVYAARHQLMGVERALKIILPLAAMTERARRSFVREATEQARLRHPRIVEVHELLEMSPGVFCIVMELVDGVDAATLLAQSPERRLPLSLTATIVGQALDGLGHAHHLGVVHRDVKDANILIAGGSPDVAVKLADFGLAKAFETSGGSGFTRTGETGGTLHYMAPEQLLDYRGVRPAADLYSMGVVLYRLLTGAFPLEIAPDENPLTVLLEKPIVPLHRRAPDLPAALAAVVARALEKRPDRRFSTAEEMKNALLTAAS